MYYTKKSEILKEIDVSRGALDRWLSRKDAPKRTKRGWPRLETDEFCQKMKKASILAQTGPNADLKRLKIEREVALLDERIALARIERDDSKRESDKQQGLLIPKRDHIDILLSHASIVKTMLERLPGEVGDLTRDAAVMTAIRSRCNDTINAIGQECERAGI